MKLSDFRKYAVLCSTLILCVFLFSFLHNLKSQFDKVEKDYLEHRVVNLSSKTLKDSKALSDILYSNGYVAEKKDAEYIADTLTERVKRLKYSNLFDLQKRAYGKIPMLVAERDSVLTDKVENSNKAIGLSDTLPAPHGRILNMGEGNGEMTVIVKSEGDSNVENVVIRVAAHYLQNDSVVSEVIGCVKTDPNGVAIIKGLDTAKGYSVLPIRRGYEYGKEKGIVCGQFDEYKYFHRFWKKKYVFSFEQLEHRVQMIDNYTLKQIKNDGTITVRTPSEYKSTVIRWFVFVLLGWWALCYVMIRRKKNFDPVLIAAAMFMTSFCVLMMFSIQNPLTEDLRGVEMAKGVLMGLIGVIALQYVDFVKLYQGKYKFEFDPLYSLFVLPDSSLWPFLPFKQKVERQRQVLLDEKRGVLRKTGACVVILLCLLLHIAFYIVRWLILPFKRKVKWFTNVLTRKDVSALLMAIALIPIALCIPFLIIDVFYLIEKKPSKGIGWLLLALLLTALLWSPLGQSIGGMRVNIRMGGLTFQPSEMAKYMIMFFMAAFFTQRADDIINYSRPAKRRLLTKLWSKTKTLGWVIVGLVLLMGMYAVLGDMGPALVIGITFVLLYSLVKSKVNLENLGEDDRWRRIFTCDFAMLIYGVVSFALFIVTGRLIGDALIGAVLWFIAWIFFGWTRHKQFFETAFIMNLLVFVFIFGGQIMQEIPPLAGTDVAERFEQRTQMCVNTWGRLDIEHQGTNAEEVSNTQVANGLWALATGGMTGQGLGDGNSNLIPAFHTDMILSSIGEQTGWIGLLVVVLVLALLLRRMIVVGYRVGHPFAFYFCSGVAIVTGVQFFIIALGSSGMVPLTGITVPFLSYGRVSMILNLVAFGIVLSFSQNIRESRADIVTENVRQRSVGEYNYPVSIVSWTFVVIALFTVGVWQYYCFWNRGNTLVHPAFVYNNEGAPIIEYNPRIALLTKEMWAGDIYDRNGVLLATSDNSKINPKEYVSKGLNEKDVENVVKSHHKRYYPFGEHLFFMLGDIDNGLFFSYNEDNPIGYMAEAQHLAYLRDYDNVMRDKEGNAVTVKLKDKTLVGNRFVKGSERDTAMRYVVRDNSDLIKYLKGGIHGKALKRHNEKVREGKFDLKLTLDAQLQTVMQNKLQDYVIGGKAKEYNNRRSGLEHNKRLRISVVVLDAENGDLLTSANYPIANYDRLEKEEERARAEGRKYAVYSDNKKDKDWSAYTDRDLGLTYPTPPGSTAKIMSAMAGLNKLGTEKGSNTKFDIQLFEVIDYNSKGVPVEPPMNGNTHEWVDMNKAIVVSSNCYFINLVNEYDLYDELKNIYYAAGIRLERRNTYNLRYKTDTVNDELDHIVNTTRSDALSLWNAYQKDKANGRYVNGRDRQRLRKGPWMWAWGQGTMDATPLAMARVVSAVANDGAMPHTRYIMNEEVSTQELTSKNNALALIGFMRGQYADHSIRKNDLDDYKTLGGKTGTPHRSYTAYNRRKAENKNDGWYVFYVDNKSVDKSRHNIAVAVRMERVGLSGGSSTDAMWLSRRVVIPVLEENGYIIEKQHN